MFSDCCLKVKFGIAIYSIHCPGKKQDVIHIKHDRKDSSSEAIGEDVCGKGHRRASPDFRAR